MYAKRIKNINLGIYIFDFTDSARLLLSNIHYSRLWSNPPIKNAAHCAAFFICIKQMNFYQRFYAQTNLVRTVNSHKSSPRLAVYLD